MAGNDLRGDKATGELGKPEDIDPSREASMLPIFETYTNELISQGRARAQLSFAFNLFTRYLEETGLSWERFTFKEAQGVQTAMMALVSEDGGRKYAPSTVVQFIGSLKGFYAWAKRKRLIHQNPFIRVQVVKQPKRLPKDIYEVEQMEALLSWLADFGSEPTLKGRRERYLAHIVAELMYSTSLLVGEVKTLRPEDLDLDRRTLSVFIPQFKKTRTAFLSEYSAETLRLFINELRPVFLASPNYRSSRHLLFGTSAELTRTVNKVLLEGSTALGLPPCTTRMFRHALCLHLIKAGCDARFAQELVGHEDLSTTQLYVNLDKRDLRGLLDKFHPRGTVNPREIAR